VTRARTRTRSSKTASSSRGAGACGRPVRQLVALLALAVVCLPFGSASGAPAAKPSVTLIGDSIAESLEYVPTARRYLGRGLDLRVETAVCRRLVYESCAFRGGTPATALQVVAARGRSLGSVVIVDVGYNDWAAVYRPDRLVRALAAAGVRTIVWVTLRETTANYAAVNTAIRKAGRRWKSVVVADWNTYSRGRAWFREDGLHLTPSGAVGLAHLLRPLVLHARRT
jgi:lysophospholipase L1-like esterase